MPQVTVYIREEDLDKWKAVDKKSAFISEALNSMGGEARPHVFPKDKVPQPVLDKKFTEYINKASVPIVEPKFVPKAPDPVEGYPCCKLKKPCKHWAWDGENEGWVNSITGEIKEVV